MTSPPMFDGRKLLKNVATRNEFVSAPNQLPEPREIDPIQQQVEQAGADDDLEDPDEGVSAWTSGRGLGSGCGHVPAAAPGPDPQGGVVYHVAPV
jgi:hypothetical protein